MDQIPLGKELHSYKGSIANGIAWMLLGLFLFFISGGLLFTGLQAYFRDGKALDPFVLILPPLSVAMGCCFSWRATRILRQKVVICEDGIEYRKGSRSSTWRWEQLGAIVRHSTYNKHWLLSSIPFAPATEEYRWLTFFGTGGEELMYFNEDDLHNFRQFCTELQAVSLEKVEWRIE